MTTPTITTAHRSVRLATVAVAVAALTGIASAAHAQLLQFNTVGNLGTEITEPSTFNAAGVAPTNLTLGAGITPAANGNRFGGSNYFDTGDTVAGTTLAESIAGNDFIQFILTPTAGSTISVTGFNFIFDRSATGPSSVALRSSFDNFAADLGNTTVAVGNTTNFTNFTFTGLNTVASATTFRLYGYGATATGGVGGFDTANAATVPNVELTGTVVPEPTTVATVIGGLLTLGVIRLRRRQS